MEIDTSGSQNHDSSTNFQTTGMIIGNNEINSSSGNKNNTKTVDTRRKAMVRKRRSRRGGGGRKQATTGGRFGGRRMRRLWQLPKSSIDEYTKWIQEKPEEERTQNEQRFLWKSMIRSLGVVACNAQSGGKEKNTKRSRQERIREFVDRLEAKNPMELTENEEQFVRLYHKRRKDRKAHKQRKQQQQEDEPTVSWMRNDDGNSYNSTCGNSENVRDNHKGNQKKNMGLEPLASLESLRESMKKMGLSSDKLKQVRFAEEDGMSCTHRA